MLRAFCQDERGVTAIEYALIGTLISVAIVAGAGTIGSEVSDLFETIRAALAG